MRPGCATQRVRPRRGSAGFAEPVHDGRQPDTIDGMDSPSQVRIKVDRQGRLVLPLWLRRELVSAPGEVVLRRTADGVLLTRVASGGDVEQASDGLPVLRLGRRVTNDEVIDAIGQERASR